MIFVYIYIYIYMVVIAPEIPVAHNLGGQLVCKKFIRKISPACKCRTLQSGLKLYIYKHLPIQMVSVKNNTMFSILSLSLDVHYCTIALEWDIVATLGYHG